MKKFYIHEANIERLRAKVNRIRNKCMKYGCDFVYSEIGEEFRTIHPGTEREQVARFIIVEAEGTAVINGWEFVASIEHLSNGNIINTVKDIDIPKRYFTADCDCEHCHSHRHRKETYLVFNEETGEFKQVGSSCLCDFTQGLSAEVAASYISCFEDMMEFEAPPEGHSFTRYYDLTEILKYAIQYIKDLGYASTQAEMPTKERVFDAYLYDHGTPMSNYVVEEIHKYRNKFNPNYNDPELLKEVEEVIEHASNLSGDSAYENNLKVIAKAGFVSGSNMGYAVSMPTVFNRYKEREARRIAAEKVLQEEIKASEHVGSIKERITINNPTVSVITSWETEWDYVTRYKIVADGNVYMWDTSSYIELSQKIDKIVGTVKKHDEFRGVKQTWLTRCRVTYIEDEHDDDHESSNGVENAVREFLESVS